MKQTLRNAKHLKNILIACLAGLPSLAALGDGTNIIPNPLIDYTSFLATATEVGRVREARRVSEDRFIKMAAEPGTIVLDARSDDKYNRLHIKGSRHLSFSEITAENLAKILPDKSARVLIYCNNNFLNSPVAFASKVASASLNIHTFNALYNYGYKNVYELGPLIDIKATKLQFEGNQLDKP